MKKRVYIETSIPSFYCEIRTEPEMVARCSWTREWWDQQSYHRVMKMKPDPVIEIIRTVRREISKGCNHDPKMFVAHYRAMEKRFKNRILKRTVAKAL